MPKKSQTPPRPRRGDGEPEFVLSIRTALRDPDPIALLGLVSSALTVAGREPAASGLLDSLLGVDLAETTAVLAVWAELTPDELARRRIARELAERAHPLPRWLCELHRAVSRERAAETVHCLADGDNIAIGVRLADGRELSAWVYVDHNMGTLVKDAFVVSVPMEVMLRQFVELADDPAVEVRDIPAADARARIGRAIADASSGVALFPTDSWPACRPLVEWMAAKLPPGGTPYVRPEWDPAALATLAERFLASPYGRAFRGPVHREQLDSILWLGSTLGPGDPLHLSPVSVELMLLDYVPRLVVDAPEGLGVLPDVLRPLIRFAHAERGIGADLTAETLAAVSRWEPAYREAIGALRRGPGDVLGQAALFARLDDPADDAIVLELLREQVGGEAFLLGLDAEPLRNEPFDWAAVPADVHDGVREVVDAVDRCCAELLDTEYRTACRRLLADVASARPELFRRGARPQTSAAAVCWIVGKANGLFGHRAALRMQAKDLMAHFGVGSPGRSRPFLEALGVDPGGYSRTASLGSRRYLVAEQRARIMGHAARIRSGI